MTAPEIHIDTFIPFMRDVARCERSLHELNLMWRLIESSAKMHCAEEAHSMLPMMAATREGFERLEQDLVHSMVSQSVQEVMAEIRTCAHHVIDIVVRNLYERTADVGFLATDGTLCNYVAGLADGRGIAERLRAYRSKYSVYDEILLLDADGTVLAQIDETSPVEGSLDPLLAQTLAHDGFVETFRHTDLRPHHAQSLLYSHRMLHPQTGQPCGVLCLSFDFAGEMAGIFAGSPAAQGHLIGLLLDEHNQVIATSDAAWIGIGTRVPTNQDGAPVLHTHSGRTYLVQTVSAHGYQGYAGPAGWKGQVMIPIEQAFGTKTMRCVDGLPAHMSQGLLAHAKTFCPPLHDIITAADSIRRVVWNGQVMTAGQRGGSVRLKAVLEQIGETGARTNTVFTQSIRDLYDTVLSAGLRDAQSLTQLLVDLLDRNLYERANDCRWWALSPVLRRLLTQAHAGQPVSDAELAQASQVLEHINSLYTVYGRLMVYDRQGRVLCASHPVLPGGSSVVGQSIDSATLQAVLQLQGQQSYYVTPWADTHLGCEGATYVYHAPIRHDEDAGLAVGGIAIVFNGQEELHAMLRNTLVDQPDTHALYVNRAGQVLASTDPQVPAGSQVQLPVPQLLHVHCEHSQSVIDIYQGQYCILGSSVTRGYREFKNSDGYDDEVIALCMASFGKVGAPPPAAASSAYAIDTAAGLAGGVEMATFFVDHQLLALRAECVLEALPATAINAVSAGRLPYCLGTLARHAQGVITGYVWVFDLGHLLTGKPTNRQEQSQVIVLEHNGRKLGVLVTALHGVHHFPAESIIPAPSLAGGPEQLIHELVKANRGQLLVQCLNPQALLETLQRRPESSMTVPTPVG